MVKQTNALAMEETQALGGPWSPHFLSSAQTKPCLRFGEWFLQPCHGTSPEHFGLCPASRIVALGPSVNQTQSLSPNGRVVALSNVFTSTQGEPKISQTMLEVFNVAPEQAVTSPPPYVSVISSATLVITWRRAHILILCQVRNGGPELGKSISHEGARCANTRACAGTLSC